LEKTYKSTARPDSTKYSGNALRRTSRLHGTRYDNDMIDEINAIRSRR